jgi:hypothetical protein
MMPECARSMASRWQASTCKPVDDQGIWWERSPVDLYACGTIFWRVLLVCEAHLSDRGAGWGLGQLPRHTRVHNARN